MATEYQLRIDNGQVVVVLDQHCQISRDELLALLAEAGINPDDVIFVEPDALAELGDLAGVPVIIPVDDDTCELPQIETAGRQGGTSGGRVVVLFGPDCQFEGLHPVAANYGTQCHWSPEAVRGCVSGDADQPRDATGKPAEWAGAQEVKCRR